MKEKKKLLFVCLGNICRSPLAEALMRQIQTEYNLNFELDSAGTSGYHNGELPDARTRANALKNGLDISYLRARQFKPNDLEAFDQIFTMDRNNLLDIQKAHLKSEHLHKLSLLPHPEKQGEYIEIPDPYFGTETDFENVFQLLNKSITALCRELSKIN
ncbi:MAG: low molecular weight phosphotyrosine protein phosphatase [Bacteroidia bacterium]|jgi:protein-tyrosine phosphatase|nr:low molecular weight phosphotyrosine protein phosphatase [Bacteroidia bacterium]